MRAPRSHCFSPHMSNRHIWQLKKSKFWGPFWSYQLNSTANPAHLPQKLGQMGWIGSAVSSKTAPRILIFSIAICADYSYEVKYSEIWAPAFFNHNNSCIATVSGQACFELVVTYTIVKLQAVDLKTYLEAMYEWSCVLDAVKVHVSDVVEMLLCWYLWFVLCHMFPTRISDIFDIHNLTFIWIQNHKLLFTDNFFWTVIFLGYTYNSIGKPVLLLCHICFVSFCTFLFYLNSLSTSTKQINCWYVTNM